MLFYQTDTGVYFAVICNWASQVVLVIKNPLANAGDAGSIPGLGRSPGGGPSHPLQFSCLEIPWTEELGGLQSLGSQKSQTRLSD